MDEIQVVQPEDVPAGIFTAPKRGKKVGAFRAALESIAIGEVVKAPALYSTRASGVGKRTNKRFTERVEGEFVYVMRLA